MDECFEIRKVLVLKEFNIYFGNILVLIKRKVFFLGFWKVFKWWLVLELLGLDELCYGGECVCVCACVSVYVVFGNEYVDVFF